MYIIRDVPEKYTYYYSLKQNIILRINRNNLVKQHQLLVY